MRDPITYWKPGNGFVAELADYLQGKAVLEVFAGNGYLASELDKRGVRVTCTSLLSGHDGHGFGFHHEVEELGATEAARKYQDTHDILLMSWPVADESAYEAAKAWGTEKPIVYIGEAPRPDLPGLSGLSGCASDRFFASITWDLVFSSYCGNMLEKAGVIRFTGH